MPKLLEYFKYFSGCIVCISNGSLNLIWFTLAHVILYFCNSCLYALVGETKFISLFIALRVIVLLVNALQVILLQGILLQVILLHVILMQVILLQVILLQVILMQVILLQVILMHVILLQVILLQKSIKISFSLKKT